MIDKFDSYEILKQNYCKRAIRNLVKSNSHSSFHHAKKPRYLSAYVQLDTHSTNPIRTINIHIETSVPWCLKCLLFGLYTNKDGEDFKQFCDLGLPNNRIPSPGEDLQPRGKDHNFGRGVVARHRRRLLGCNIRQSLRHHRLP